MLPYKNYLIEEYSIQKPMMANIPGSTALPSTVLTTHWETRIIDTSSGKSMQVASKAEAMRVIDEWALFGDPEALLAREKQIQEKTEALATLDQEVSAKIAELTATRNKAIRELTDLIDSTPQRFE